eukprot:g307.t1
MLRTSKRKRGLPASAAEESLSKKPACTIVRSIAYGSIVFWQGKDADEYHSHKWTVFVRGLDGEDLGYIIKTVAFSLHPSFSVPVRLKEEHPFEVTETGWGEFEVGIRIYFVDDAVPPLNLSHHLRLYPAEKNAVLSEEKPVVHEHYDEILFHDPPEAFKKILLSGPRKKKVPHPLMEHFTTFKEIEDLKRLRAAQAFIEKELEESAKELEMLHDEKKRSRQKEKEKKEKKKEENGDEAQVMDVDKAATATSTS